MRLVGVYPDRLWHISKGSRGIGGRLRWRCRLLGSGLSIDVNVVDVLMLLN